MDNPLRHPSKIAVAVFNKHSARMVTVNNMAKLIVDQPGEYVKAAVRIHRQHRELLLALALTGTEKLSPEETAERYKWLGQI